MALNNLGMVVPGSKLWFPFSTYDSNDPSASVTVTGLATTDIEIYKDGSLTQRASDAGYAVDADVDGVVGVHWVEIDLADNTTANFFAAGSRYVVMTGDLTVDAATVRTALATFEIGYSGAFLNTTIATLSTQTSFTLTKGPAEADALNGCVVVIHDVASAVQLGYAVISDYAATTKTVTLAAGTSFTAAAGDNICVFPPTNVNAWNTVALATTNPLPNAAADAAGGLPISDAGGLDMDAILVDTNSLNDTKVPDTISLANINAQVDTALSDINLDHLVGTATGIPAVPAGTYFDQMLDDGTAVFDRTTDSLQAIRDSGGGDVNVTQWNGSAVATPTVAGVPLVDLDRIEGTENKLAAHLTKLPPYIGDFVGDETIPFFFEVAHTTLASSLQLTNIEIYKNGSVTQRSSTSGYTLLDTDGIDFDGLTGIHGFSVDLSDNTDAGFFAVGNEYFVVFQNIGGDPFDTIIATFSIQNRQTGTGATAGAIADAVWDEDATAHQTTGTFGQAIGDPGANTETMYDAVVTDAAGTNVAADVIAVKSDTAAILVDTGTTLDTKINDIQGATFSSATDSLEAIRDRGDAAWTTGGAGSGLTPLDSGTLQAGGTSTQAILPSARTFADDILNGTVINLLTGTGAGQSRVIIDYAGASDTATVTPAWTTNPDATTTYEIVQGSVNLTAISNAAEDVALGSDITTQIPNVLNTTASGNIGIDWANVENPTTAVDLSATDIQLADTVTTLTGHTAQTGDNFARLGAPAGASVSADIAAIEAQTDDIGVAGAGLTAIPFNAAWTTEVEDAVWDSLAANHLASGSFGTLALGNRRGVAQLGTATSIRLAATENPTSGLFVGMRIAIIGGTGAGQARHITAYNGATLTCTTEPAWTTNPDATSEYVIENDSNSELRTATQTSIDAIETDTGTTIPGTITTLQADTDDIQTRLPAALVGGRMDSDVEAINNDTTSADNLAKSARGIIPGTAATGTLSTTQMTTDLSGFANDELIGGVVVFTGGTADGQRSDITDYASASGLVTFTAITTAPANGDTFVIV